MDASADVSGSEREASGRPTLDAEVEGGPSIEEATRQEGSRPIDGSDELDTIFDQVDLDATDASVDAADTSVDVTNASIDVATASVDAADASVDIANAVVDAADASDSSLDFRSVDAGDAPPDIGAVCDSSIGPTLATSHQHTCVLMPTGRVSCWGNNTDGELGNGTLGDNRPTPVATQLPSRAKAIAAGFAHTCAVTVEGGVRCWGNNYSGQLGLGPDASDIVMLPTPPDRDVLSAVQAIATGSGHTCALTTQGGVRCWGSNQNGQLGIGSTAIVSLSTPPSTDAIGGVAAVSAGFLHTCAVTRAGAVLCWGSNDHGQLGDGTLTDRAGPPTTGVPGVEAVAVATGNAHTCVLTKTKSVRCWGWNTYGQLGNNSLDDRSTPTGDVLTDVQAIAAGDTFTCALNTAGAVICWGNNLNYQLGHTLMDEPLPPGPPVPLSSAAKAVAAGEEHACAVLSDDTVQCWGNNEHGQLGDSTTSTAVGRPNPATVVGLDASCP